MGLAGSSCCQACGSVVPSEVDVWDAHDQFEDLSVCRAIRRGPPSPCPNPAVPAAKEEDVEEPKEVLQACSHREEAEEAEAQKTEASAGHLAEFRMKESRRD